MWNGSGVKDKKQSRGEVEAVIDHHLEVYALFSLVSTNICIVPPLPSSRPRENYPIIKKVCLPCREQLVDAGATSAKFGAGLADHWVSWC